MDLAGASTWLFATASVYLLACARNPIRGFESKIFCQAAVSVHTSTQQAGTRVTQAKPSRFILNSTLVHRIKATPASIWLEMPNNGHKVLMPPKGSTTP